MRSRRWRSWAIAPLLVALAAAACTRGDKGDDPDRSARAERGTISLAIHGPIVADPAKISLAEPAGLMAIDLLWDGLTALDRTGTAVPALATSWEADATQKQWTFHLDPAATFASGRPVTAADVVGSLERVARGGDASLAAVRLEPISGFRAFVDGTVAQLSGLRAVDDRTIEITVDVPLSVLPVLLASPVYGVVDAASLDAVQREDLHGLDLSGDWKVEAGSGSALRVQRRAGAPGKVDTVELRPFADDAAAYAAFEQGDADWAEVPDQAVGDAIEKYGDAAFAPFHAELFFGMRVHGVALGNPELRKAVAAAIDPKAIVRAVYPNLANPLSQVVPAGVPGRTANPCSDACGYDPERARSVLAAAFPNGGVPSVPVDFDDSPAQAAMARIVADDLEAVGIPTELRPRPLEDYKQFVVSGDPELFSFGWIGGYLSPDAYLSPLYASASDDNLSGFGSAEVDGLLGQVRGEPLGATSIERWAGVERLVLEDSVVVPIAQFRTQVVLAARVKGFAHAVDGSVDWAAVTLSE